jgi:hypothetical protein
MTSKPKKLQGASRQVVTADPSMHPSWQDAAYLEAWTRAYKLGIPRPSYADWLAGTLKSQPTDG